MGLLFREHPKAQPEGGFRRSPGSNLRPLARSLELLFTRLAFNMFCTCSMLTYPGVLQLGLSGETSLLIKPVLRCLKYERYSFYLANVSSCRLFNKDNGL